MINGPSKMLFFDVYLYPFSKFQMLVSRVVMKFYFITNIFDLYIFDNKTADLLIFFEICTEMHFVSLFFLNEKNITFRFDDTFKMYCCALYYSKCNLHKQTV